MDSMDVDTAVPRPNTNPSTSHKHARINHPDAKPLAITSPTSRFNPTPPTSNHPASQHTSDFAPFAANTVGSMYSQKIFKPLSSSPPSSSPLLDLPVHRAPFKPTPPVQIPHPAPRSFPSPSFSPDRPIPHSLPTIQPSFPATLFGGMSAEDEHVTVWEPATAKTVAGNAAPYRRNLTQWLTLHPGWEEKSDELKSSKRRSAARRGRSAADAFAALCHYPVSNFLVNDAALRLRALADEDHLTEQKLMSWGSDDFVRLQEALFRLGQQCHTHAMNLDKIDTDRWPTVCAQVGGSKMEGTVVACAHHMLTRGIAKSRKESAATPTSVPSSFGAVTPPGGYISTIGSPASLNSNDINFAFDVTGPSSLPGLSGASGALLLEKSFRAPREPRVTVWNPNNGRTISGNAAPCKRNLDNWMRLHPGWVPKEEGQLSSSRRNRNRKFRPSSVPSGAGGTAPGNEPESPHFNDALQGLLFLSRSPTAYSPSDADVDADMGDDDTSTLCHSNSAGGSTKKNGIISSVSSSSAEDGVYVDGDDGIDEDREPKQMEL